MHILIIPSWYRTSERPLRGIFFREQAHALLKAGHQVSILTIPDLKSKSGLKRVRRFSELAPTVDIENDAGLMTYRTTVWGWIPGFLKKWAPDVNLRANLCLQMRGGCHAFKKYVQEQGLPDVIHAHSILYGAYLAVLIGQRWNIPVVFTEHSSAFLRDLIRPKQIDTIRYTLQNADKCLAVGHSLASALQSYAPDTAIEVIGNVVNTEYFVPLSEELPSSPFVFATVAFLTANKGLDILLKAFALVFRGKKVILRLGGDGPQRKNLEKQAEELKITSQVKFLGQLSREQVRSLLQTSHALVSTSYIETFGITLIEAMACGKPVVATRSGGPDSFVTHENGILVAVGDVNSLAAGMKKVSEGYAQYNPAHIRAICVERFSEPVIVQKLEQIYSSFRPFGGRPHLSF